VGGRLALAGGRSPVFHAASWPFLPARSATQSTRGLPECARLPVSSPTGAQRRAGEQMPAAHAARPRHGGSFRRGLLPARQVPPLAASAFFPRAPSLSPRPPAARRFAEEARDARRGTGSPTLPRAVRRRPHCQRRLRSMALKISTVSGRGRCVCFYRVGVGADDECSSSCCLPTGQLQDQIRLLPSSRENAIMHRKNFIKSIILEIGSQLPA
jgi:hypothetical protein